GQRPHWYRNRAHCRKTPTRPHELVKPKTGEKTEHCRTHSSRDVRHPASNRSQPDRTIPSQNGSVCSAKISHTQAALSSSNQQLRLFPRHRRQVVDVQVALPAEP